MANDELLQTILRAIRNLRFGTLEIVVHDSKVVRIERRERIRLEMDADGERIKDQQESSTS